MKSTKSAWGSAPRRRRPRRFDRSKPKFKLAATQLLLSLGERRAGRRNTFPGDDGGTGETDDPEKTSQNHVTKCHIRYSSHALLLRLFQ